MVVDRGGFSNGQLAFSSLQNTLLNAHEIPVNKVRFSRQFPRMLVSCGDERDVKLKLWNVAQKQDDEKATPLHI